MSQNGSNVYHIVMPKNMVMVRVNWYDSIIVSPTLKSHGAPKGICRLNRTCYIYIKVDGSMIPYIPYHN